MFFTCMSSDIYSTAIFIHEIFCIHYFKKKKRKGKTKKKTKKKKHNVTLVSFYVEISKDLI